MITEILNHSLYLVLALPLLSLLTSHFRHAWRYSLWLSGLNLGLALVLGGFSSQQPLATGLLQLSLLKGILLVLVNFLGWIIYRYAASNFRADLEAVRFLRWVTLTLLSVQSLLLMDNLLAFWLAWTAVSICLHELLMFYPERPRAILAAHKKFFVARASEILLGLAFWLLYSAHHQASMVSLLQQVSEAPLVWQDRLAALCLALVALLKCAQLPLHGWLIQVVESPTPVSALLHAGIVNLGGVLLLLFAPLFSRVVEAQWLVLVVAAPSAVLASLIMTTRVSIKVRLAWSTCAQMGLMLVECALGLYELALLHLLAHSCYKARAFLTSGSSVQDYLNTQVGLGLAAPATQGTHKLAGALLFLLTLVGLVVAHYWWMPAHAYLAPILLLAITLMVLTNTQLESSPALGLTKTLAYLLLVYGALLVPYGLIKLAFVHYLALPVQAYSLSADLWVFGWIVLMLVIYSRLQYQPLSPAMRRVWIALNAGLYLDEWMTRLTLRWWPIVLTPSAVTPSFLDTEVRS